MEVPCEVDGGCVDGGIRKRVDGDAQRLQALLQGDGLAHCMLEPREGEGSVLDEGVAGCCSLGVRRGGRAHAASVRRAQLRCR